MEPDETPEEILARLEALFQTTEESRSKITLRALVESLERPTPKRRPELAANYTNDVNVLVEKFRSQIRTIRPYQRMTIRVNSKLLEEFHVSKRFEDRPPQL